MELKEYDNVMLVVAAKRRQASEMLKEANALEGLANQRAGVYHTDRDPGFPCWKIRGVSMPYCGSPREALETATRLKDRNES
jgi:hypothetical protein